MKVFKKNAAFFAVPAVFLLGALSVAAQTGAPQQEKLLNGMKVLMWSDPKADSVSLRVRIHAGSSFDPQGKEGVMQLLADSLFPNEAARDFFTEDLGGSLRVSTTYDFIEINTSAKPVNLVTMLETVSTAVSNPQIDKELTAKIKASLLARLDELAGDPEYVADNAAAARLFGTFPYGRPIAGTKDSVVKIDFADLVDARQRFLTADNATVAVIGNFDKALAFRAIRRYFGSWLKADRRVPSTFKQPDDPPAQTLSVPLPRPGDTAVRLAFRGPARSDKDLAASLVFAAILENRVRSKLPTTKNVFVRNEPHILPGSVVIGYTPAGAGSPSLDIFRGAMADVITEAEFASVKQSVQAAWTRKDVPTFWLDADTYKIGNVSSDLKAIETVTLNDVRSYADRSRQKPVASVVVAPAGQ